jgi:pimeloyl-ACP methyl ester carboxylesterase
MTWQPHTGETFSGGPLKGELTYIQVPEDHFDTRSESIELAVVRYRTTNPNPGPPIFYLAGGPGASGVTYASRVATHPQLRLLEHRDVIGIDQRGTGLSSPNLSEPSFPWELPLDQPATRAMQVAAFSDAVRRSVVYWQDRGVDLTAYNSMQSADDIDTVRRALGYDRILLYGSSYGSHLAIACLRRHQEHVSRALLINVEGPDHTWKLPASTHDVLTKVSRLAAHDSRISAQIPDLMHSIRDLLDRLQTQPVTVTVPDSVIGEQTVVLGAYDLQVTLAHMLGDVDRIREIPRLVYQLLGNQWEVLARRAIEHRHGHIHSAMAIMMDCASGVSPTRQQLIEKQAADTTHLLQDALHNPFYYESCRHCPTGDLGDDLRESFTCTVPVLFVSGTLDARTPPDNVEAIAAWFPNHAHVVVTNASHDSRELMSREYRSLVQAFLRGEQVESCTLHLPLLFDDIEAPATGVD